MQIHETSCPGAGDSIKKGGEQNQSYQSRTLREHVTCSSLGSLQSTSSGPDVTRKIQGKVQFYILLGKKIGRMDEEKWSFSTNRSASDLENLEARYKSPGEERIS